jgi:phosphatidylethanolamine/phosphatidyl-N-methylethanolamine N-methyltransferase
MTTTAVARVANRHGYRFLKEFITKPFVIGAIAPSSKRLARKMVEGVNFARTKAIVEFGPGTGAFTDKILRRIAPDCRYFAIELNPTMAELWRQRHPGATLRLDSVKNVDVLCREEGIDQVDVIFSGLPWASFDDQLQEETLEASLRVLRPGGQLITFGYRVGTMLPKGRRFYRRLPRYFSKVERSEYVWRNLPPAFVVRCTK